MKSLYPDVLDVVTTLPAAGVKGRIVTLNSDGHVYADNGSGWDDLTAQSAGVDVDELYQELQFAQLVKYVKFTYTDGNLTKKEIFEDNTEAVKLFNADFIYTSGNLTSIEVERMSDMSTYTKTFNYTDGNLTSIGVT